MDFKDTINQLAERISKQKELIQTEEATKNAFIMPMIAALGYDIFNPTEVVPEFTCDVGPKKGEKIDYAIMQNNKPVLLIECKHCGTNLDPHDAQLTRYFTVSDARFAILTNGIEYRFYTDLDKTNIMDRKPFLVINILDITDNEIEQLKKFHKSYFNEDTILSTAAELQISTSLKEVVIREFQDPTQEFVKYFVKEINNGSYSKKLIDQCTPLLKKSISNYVNDVITDRLNNAIKEGKNQDSITEEITQPEPDNDVVTTDEEIDAFLIIKNILRKNIDVTQINYIDFKSYFLVHIYDKQSKWVCRLFLKANKYISFPKPEGGENKIEIKTIDEIYNYSEQLTEALKLRL